MNLHAMFTRQTPSALCISAQREGGGGAGVTRWGSGVPFNVGYCKPPGDSRINRCHTDILALPEDSQSKGAGQSRRSEVQPTRLRREGGGVMGRQPRRDPVILGLTLAGRTHFSPRSHALPVAQVVISIHFFLSTICSPLWSLGSVRMGKIFFFFKRFHPEKWEQGPGGVVPQAFFEGSRTGKGRGRQSRFQRQPRSRPHYALTPRCDTEAAV